MTRFAVPLLLSALCVSPTGADDIRLRARVELDAKATDVHLRDVATLTGPAAERHGDLVVATLTTDTDELALTIAELRAMLDDAGVHWGLVNLNGHRSRIRRAAVALPTPGGPVRAMNGDEIRPAAPADASVAPASSLRTSVTMRTAAHVLDRPTIAGALARRLVGQLGRAPEDIRFAFPPADLHWAETVFAADTASMTPRGSVRAARVTWEYRPSADVRPLPITTFVEVRSLELVAQRDLRRGEIVSAADTDVRRIWCAPVVDETLARPEDLVDGEIVRRVEAGDVLRRKHITPRRVIQRGETVRVQCDVGGTRITLDAEANEDGALGERITLRTKTGRRTFRARVTGPGVAVVDLAITSVRSGDTP